MVWLGGIIGVLVTALASVIVALIARSSTDRATDRTSVLQWAEQLQDRIDAQDKRIDALEARLDGAQRVVRAAANFIDRVGLWLAAGRRGAPPTPPEALHDHVDTTLWADVPHREE